MNLNTYKGEPVVDPGRFIRRTLRGHYVRWRLDKELAGSPSTSGPPDRETARRTKVSSA